MEAHGLSSQHVASGPPSQHVAFGSFGSQNEILPEAVGPSKSVGNVEVKQESRRTEMDIKLTETKTEQLKGKKVLIHYSSELEFSVYSRGLLV